MKRQAAITGPTPPMIQWTLLVDCPFRDLSRAPLAVAASRQLRGLREWSLAKSERRIHNGVCFHPNCDSSPDASADSGRNGLLGFPEAEPFVVFGGQARVLETCGKCPANAVGHGVDIAGCWGVIPFAEPAGSETRLAEIVLGTGQRMSVADLAGWFERLLEPDESKTEFESLFPLTTPRWYGLWTGAGWNREQTVWMAGFLEKHLAELPTPEMLQLATATGAARAHHLRLCYDRIPAGHSDSMSWLLQPHCGRCGWMHNTRRPCPCCGEQRAPLPVQKKKVMGLRPWLRLDLLFGPEETAKIVEDYQRTRGNHEPD